MSNTPELRNHFLIAMPALADPNFSHTVTYICEHSEEGAMGIVINRPMAVSLEEVLRQMEIEPSNKLDTSVMVNDGGPVQPEHGFVIHTPVGAWEASLPISEEIALTTSRDILTAIGHNEGPARYLIALGYAGWGPGQLEEELKQNAWLSGPANQEILFELPLEQRWEAAARLLGIDLNLLSSDIGHA
ncbi:MAG TPA: YqgE/AlgH family protein [Gammaproteobacteria bacterium]